MRLAPISVGLVFAGVLCAQSSFFPLKDIRPGMKGVGKTVFTGDRVEEFGVEVLGVLENVGPKQSIILARLSGGPLEKTGVMQGMSGSPVYLDGKLAGAVALAFSFSKDPIAGIRPIEEMLQAGSRPAAAIARLVPGDDLTAALPKRAASFGDTHLVEIATPLSFAGFTSGTVDHFAPRLRALGLEPRQGASGGGTPPPAMGNPASLQPGSMISVQLMSGDMAIGADGTVTHIDGRGIYAFGHRFLSIGSTELPFARAEVLTLLPNLSTSFKISSAKEWMGTIVEDRNAAVAGELGRRASLVPLAIRVASKSGGPQSSYSMRMVNDRFLSPILLQMALYSAIDATERTVGTSSFAVRGAIEFEGGMKPIELNSLYAGDANVPLQVSLSAAIPLAYAMQSGLPDLKLKGVNLEIEAWEEKRQWRIDDVWASRREAKPGETVEVAVALVADNGDETIRRVSWTVPIGAPVGTLFFTVSDGATANMSDYRQLASAAPRSAAQLISLINSLKSNHRGYVRVWKAQPGFHIQGADLAAPPPSLAMILARSPSAPPGAQSQSSKLGEMEFQVDDAAITGSRTIQVEVKE
ncbi:MAG: SpoIVB peptidase S55 domain-containing protein [Bryobacteraceae bacterium]